MREHLASFASRLHRGGEGQPGAAKRDVPMQLRQHRQSLQSPGPGGTFPRDQGGRAVLQAAQKLIPLGKIKTPGNLRNKSEPEKP